MSGGARSTALRVLINMRTDAAWADAGLRGQLMRDALSGADAALATQLVYGVVQNRLLLDFWLSAYCSQKLEHLQPPLADILRLGAYQIVFLDRVPDHAAVNESVELARQFGRSAASGLVNAVLRKISANKADLPKVSGDALHTLSVQYSHPKWLVKRLLSLLGEKETEAFLCIDNAAAPMCVQVNPLKTTPEKLEAELTAAGISVKPHAWVPGCLELRGTGDLTAVRAFQDGKFWVQDAAARLVADAAAPKAGMRVLDMCAAPGGKSFALAAAMGGKGEILACDLYENKLHLIQDGAQRLGFSAIQTAAADGRTTTPQWVERFDLVVVDAPCSGLGIIRKKPEIRNKRPDALLTLPVLQTAILDNAANYVRPSGTLIYSTCTVLPEENEHVTDSFLAEHPDFIRESFILPTPAGTVDEGQLTLWPQRHGVDGFYICRMHRK